MLSSSYHGLKLLFSDFYYNWGMAYARWGRPHRALWYFKRAAKLQTKDAQIFYQRSVLVIVLGAPERAIIDFDAAIENNPRYLEAYMNRSMMYTLIGRHEDALPDIERAVALGADRTTLERQIEAMKARVG